MYVLLILTGLLAVGLAWWFLTSVIFRSAHAYGTVGYYMEPLALYLRARLGLPVVDQDDDDSSAPRT